jgi:tRNA-2-methylthio-N6-dimethylallyladenosine synthase
MPFFHLPIQSGDEKILKNMNREMKIKTYVSLINYIRKRVPNCAISTDIIVGFPNETKKQFNNTVKLYKKIKFDNAYTFIYSKRVGTPASKILDKINLNEKYLRLEKLNNLVRKYSKENNQKFLNKVLPVLVEGKSKTNKDV